MRKVDLARGSSARSSVALVLGLTLLSGVAVAEEWVGKGTVPVLTTQNDASAEAERLYQEGMRLYREGSAESLQQAIQVWERARMLFHQGGDRAGEATTLNNTGAVYDALGEKQQALEYYNQALPLARAVSDRAGEAAILNNIGGVYSDLGEKQKALEYYNQALPLYRAAGDRAGEATALNNIGAVYDALGEKQKASEYYNQALPLYRAVSDRTGEATTLDNIGLVYHALGERQKALDYYNQALPLRRAVGDRAGEATTLNNIGGVYFDLGEKQKALEYLNQALPLYRAVGDRTGEANTLNSIGGVYADLGEKQKALDYYNQALPILRTVGDHAGEAATLNNIGVVYHALRDRQKALSYYERALPLARAVGDRRSEATTLNNLGAVYDTLGEKQKALEYITQSLPLYRAIGDKQGEALNLYNLAYQYRQQNQLSQALDNINAAISLIEDLRTKIDNTDLRTSYFATVQDYYQFKTDLLMQMGNPQEAFNTNERSRARTLLELLNTANLDLHEGADPQLLDRERQLRQQLQVIEARRAYRLNNNPTADATAAFDRESDAVLDELNQLLAQIRRTHPAYADLKQPQPLTLPQIQQQVLDPETVLLQYSLGEERSYLWVVSQNGFQHYTLPGTQELAEPLQQFQSAASIAGTPLKSIREKGNTLAQLILPEPVWAQIAGKRILVAGDGGIETIPFAALPLPNAAEYTPLLANSEILTQPSASSISVLRQQTQGRSPAPKTLALLADPVYTANDPRVTNRQQTPLPIELSSTLRSLNRSDIERLPHTRREAEAILALIPDRDRNAVFDFAADRNWSTSPQLSQYRILHFATHGLVNPVNPELSAVVLSLVNSNGLSRPGYLRLNDIFSLNLPAELVVLSACQTGLGENINGEGLVGLTRGFMYAGARRLVVSLWNVDDAATADLMASMYRKILQEKMTPAAALRAAQLEMWKEGKSPNLWAAFTVQGEWK